MLTCFESLVSSAAEGMSANSIAITSAGNWGARNEHGASSHDDGQHQSRRDSIPWPFFYGSEEGRGLYGPWRLFEERVRTGPYGLSRFPSQPYSPIRILVLDGGGAEAVNPRLRQFVRDSPPRIRGEWHLGSSLQPEEPSLTNDEFKKAMKKLKTQVYNPTNTKKRAWGRGIFGTNKTSSITTGTVDEKDGGKTCTVCLEAFAANEQVMVTPCNHIFHNDCIVPWVKSHGQCPVCRFAFCERRQAALPANNIDYGHFNAAGFGDDDYALDLIALVRAMEEAFDWINHSR